LGLSTHSPLAESLRRVLHATRSLADRGAGGKGAQLGVGGEVAGDDDAVDVDLAHLVLLLVVVC
jgi:hypothetical protein